MTCVYLHTRLDGVVFYVGIGSPKRPYSEINRNKHWHRTTEKYAYTVTILHENLSWEAACALEIELIAKYRATSGSKLCNVSTGGEGSKGLKHSDEAKERMRVAKLGNTNAVGNKGVPGNRHNFGKTVSDEVRARISAATKNPSAEVRAKISAASKGNTHALGLKHSAETRAKMSASGKGKVFSAEHRANLSAANRARPPMSEETKAKIRATKKLARNAVSDTPEICDVVTYPHQTVPCLNAQGVQMAQASILGMDFFDIREFFPINTLTNPL